MKKLFVAVALVMGVGTSVAFAGNMSTNVCAVASIKPPTSCTGCPQEELCRFHRQGSGCRGGRGRWKNLQDCTGKSGQ